MHANADMHQRVWSRIDHANSFVIVIFLAASLVLSSRASGIGVTPFLVEVTRDLQRTHKYFREPNKLDCSPSTFLEYLTLWGFSWQVQKERATSLACLYNLDLFRPTLDLGRFRNYFRPVDGYVVGQWYTSIVLPSFLLIYRNVRICNEYFWWNFE